MGKIIKESKIRELLLPEEVAPFRVAKEVVEYQNEEVQDRFFKAMEEGRTEQVPPYIRPWWALNRSMEEAQLDRNRQFALELEFKVGN